MIKEIGKLVKSIIKENDKSISYKKIIKRKNETTKDYKKLKDLSF